MTDYKIFKTNPSVKESQNNILQRKAKGEFVRGVSKFRSRLEETPEFPAEPDRYHLFIAFNCPWCHRVTLARNALGLEDTVTMDVAFPNRTGEDDAAGACGNLIRNAWRLSREPPYPSAPRKLAQVKDIDWFKQIYEAEGSDETSVPILYDKQNKCIVSNESAEIVRMLNREASRLGSSLSDTSCGQTYIHRENKVQNFVRRSTRLMIRYTSISTYGAY